MRDKSDIPCTHTDHSKFLVLSLQFRKERCSLSRSSRSSRMAQRYGSAFGVDLVHIKTQLVDAVQRLACERFIEFEDIYIFLLNASVFVESRNGQRRSYA